MSQVAIRLVIVVSISAIVAPVATLAADEPEPSKSVEQIIESYVTDFRSDRFAAEPMVFGIQVPGKGEWHVRVTGKRRDDSWEVALGDGPAPKPTFLYRIETETLRAIDRGELNAITAQGKAFASDYAPMDVINMEGYQPSPEEDALVNPFSFHFWTRGFPEIIPFGEGLTRKLHGANNVGFYYETGLRTIWSRIEPRERVRDDPREQAMPFPMLIVGIRGTAEGEVDGARISLSAGHAVFIPPQATHVWWNETDEAAEAILIMFGKGA